MQLFIDAVPLVILCFDHGVLPLTYMSAFACFQLSENGTD